MPRATRKATPKKTAAKKGTAKKTATKKTPAKKTTAKKTTTKKTPAKKAAAKKAPAKKAAAKKTPAKKTAAKKSPARKTAAKSSGPETQDFKPYKPARGEPYMSDEQREHFKSILRKWKKDLMEEVDRTVSHMKDEAANFPDPADRATQEEEFSLELRTRDRERKLIKKIDATMELIEQDDYGYCEACGIEIGIQRLEARPTASLCIDCKTLAEIKEKQELG